MYRILFNIFLFVSIFLCPTYLSFLFIIISVFILRNFFESFIFSFLLDILYGSKNVILLNSGSIHESIVGLFYTYKFTFLVLFILLISYPLKKMLKFYSI